MKKLLNAFLLDFKFWLKQGGCGSEINNFGSGSGSLKPSSYRPGCRSEKLVTSLFLRAVPPYSKNAGLGKDTSSCVLKEILWPVCR